jgi:hypothetical protein
VAKGFHHGELLVLPREDALGPGRHGLCDVWLEELQRLWPLLVPSSAGNPRVVRPASVGRFVYFLLALGKSAGKKQARGRSAIVVGVGRLNCKRPSLVDHRQSEAAICFPLRFLFPGFCAQNGVDITESRHLGNCQGVGQQGACFGIRLPARTGEPK